MVPVAFVLTSCASNGVRPVCHNGPMRFRARNVLRHLVVAAALCGLVLPLAFAGHPLLEADPDCGPAVLGAHVTTEFETDLPTSGGKHCAYCHWIRAISGVAPLSTGCMVPGWWAVGTLVPGDDRLVASALIGLKSSRAPPRLA